MATEHTESTNKDSHGKHGTHGKVLLRRTRFARRRESKTFSVLSVCSVAILRRER